MCPNQSTKKETGCEQGYSECLYNQEYDKFVKEYIKGTTEKIKQGKQPEELMIPKRIADIEKKIEEAISPND